MLEELEPFEQWVRLVFGLFQDPRVELEPAQFAVHEVLGPDCSFLFRDGCHNEDS